MSGMFIAKPTIFFDLHAVGVVLFFFGSIVVALLAILASKRYLGTHIYVLPSVLA